MAMNSTQGTVGWTPEPNGRGTIGLLWSCSITVFLCTWSAIHPNLPGPNESTMRILWRRLNYVALCLVAPEIMAWLAITALVDALSVKAKVCRSITVSSFLWLTLL